MALNQEQALESNPRTTMTSLQTRTYAEIFEDAAKLMCKSCNKSAAFHYTDDTHFVSYVFCDKDMKQFGRFYDQKQR